MRTYDSGFSAVAQGARSLGIAPVYFVWIVGKDRETGADSAMGFWSRSENIAVTVPLPGGGSASRT